MANFAQGPFECMNDCGNCCFTCCCPCFAFQEAAENIGSSDGCLYCFMTWPCCCGCCALTMLGNEVQEKRGIKGGVGKAAVCSFFDCCTCYSCSVTNEAKLIARSGGGVGAPAASKMERNGA